MIPKNKTNMNLNSKNQNKKYKIFNMKFKKIKLRLSKELKISNMILEMDRFFRLNLI